MNNVLVVYKKSTFELYGNSPDGKTREYVRDNLEYIKKSHDSQQKTLETVADELNQRNIKNHVIYRADLKELSGELKKLNGYDLIVSVGGDGTLLEVSHYVTDIHVLGVNSDSSGSTGYFSMANSGNFGYLIDNFSNTKMTRLNRLEIMLNREILPELVLNDILIAHSNPAANTRFKLYMNNQEEMFRNSSGVLICTPAGSTAFMYQENGNIMPIDFGYMQYHIRSNRKEHDMFRFAGKLEIESLTREGGIWIDGEHLRYDFALGDKIKIYMGQPLQLVCDLEEKRKHFK